MIGNATTSQSFQDTLRYVARETSQQIFSNIGSAIAGDADVNDIADAMEQEAQWSNRVKKPCYHFALSPAPDDSLSDSDWRNLTEEFLEEMGLEDRQAVGWLHHDEEYPDGRERTHLHLVVNRVDALAGAASTSWDYRRVDKVIRGLEESYQISSVDPAEEVEVRNDSWEQHERIERQQAEYDNPNHPRTEPPEPSIKGQIQEALDEAIARSPSVDEIPAYLEQRGIETQENSRGWSFDKDGIHFSGSQLGKRYSRPSVENTMAEQSLDMQEVMQQASEPNEAREEDSNAEAEREQREAEQEPREIEAEHRDHQKRQAQHMQRSGQRLIERTGEVDGLTLIGAGVAAAGTLAERFHQQLDAARDSAQDERQQQQVEQLEDIGDRASALENQLLSDEVDDEVEPNDEVIDAEIVQNQDEEDQPQVEAETGSPIENSVAIAAERIKRLEREVEIEAEPSAEQIDDAIDQLDQRLGQVEDATQQRSRPAEQDSLPTVTTAETQALKENAGARTAESLENFTLARTQFNGQVKPQPYDSSIGEVTLTREGFQDRDTRLTVTDEDFGTVFEARKDGLSGEWEGEIDELNQQEIDTVARLPQSAQEYEQYKRGQSLVKTLQDMPQTSQQFQGDRGEINWSGEDDEQDFSYTLNIEKQSDGSQQVIGQDTDNGDPVFSATISPQDNQVFVEQNDIPESQSQQLLDQRDQEQDPPELERKGLTLGAQSRSRQRELEL